MKVANDWKDYELIDAGNGEKLENWNGVILRRPDPQAIWPVENIDEIWKNPDGFYHRSHKGGGSWDFKRKLKDFWCVNYKDLTFKVSPTNFKHTGLFPEQAANWDFAIEKIKKANRPIKVLNLFAYTGGATMACSYAGATEVVHVDAAKGMVEWAKENMKLSKLENNKIRFIVDDCIKFVEREIRRGNKYDVIIMDPPSYGRGPKGEIWKIEESVFPFIELCSKILSDDPLFFLINSYTTGLQPAVLNYMINTAIVSKFGGHVEADEIGVNVSSNGLVLPCGASGRWSK